MGHRLVTRQMRYFPRFPNGLKSGFGRRLAGATGLEPATYGVTGRHSNQLSYAPAGALRHSRKGRPM